MAQKFQFLHHRMGQLKQKLLTQFFLTQMELEKMEFNFQSKSTDGKTSISERPENRNVIGNEEFDVLIKNDGPKTKIRALY